MSCMWCDAMSCHVMSWYVAYVMHRGKKWAGKLSVLIRDFWDIVTTIFLNHVLYQGHLGSHANEDRRFQHFPNKFNHVYTSAIQWLQTMLVKVDEWRFSEDIIRHCLQHVQSCAEYVFSPSRTLKIEDCRSMQSNPVFCTFGALRDSKLVQEIALLYRNTACWTSAALFKGNRKRKWLF